MVVDFKVDQRGISLNRLSPALVVLFFVCILVGTLVLNKTSYEILAKSVDGESYNSDLVGFVDFI